MTDKIYNKYKKYNRKYECLTGLKLKDNDNATYSEKYKRYKKNIYKPKSIITFILFMEQKTLTVFLRC